MSKSPIFSRRMMLTTTGTGILAAPFVMTSQALAQQAQPQTSMDINHHMPPDSHLSLIHI